MEGLVWFESHPLGWSWFYQTDGKKHGPFRSYKALLRHFRPGWRAKT